MITDLIERILPAETTLHESRRVHRSDAGEMEKFVSRLSRETLYMRFHLPYPEFPKWALEGFLGSALDGECIVALEEGRIVGHAMYAVEPDGRSAEVALVVEDARQGRGVGKYLLRELTVRAERRGVEAFFCRALSKNHRVPGLVRSVFGEMTEEFEDGMRVIRSPLGSLRPEGRR